MKTKIRTRILCIAILTTFCCLAFTSGIYGQTKNMMQEALMKGDSVRAFMIKATGLIQSGKTKEASEILINIMEHYPNNREAVQYWLIANMKRTPDGEKDAILTLDSLGKIYPQNTGIIFFKTFIQAEYGQNEEALAGVEKLIALQPDTADNWIRKGQMLAAMNKYQEAITAFDKATSLNPKQPDTWFMKASVLAKMGKFDEAIACITKLIEIMPNYPVSFYNRACYYCLKGDKANALADLEKAISMNPNYKESAVKDEDFKSLYEDEDFKKLTKEKIGILKGEETLSKTILVSKPEIGNVTSLRVLTNLSDTDAVLLVIGHRGALMLAPEGRVKSVVRFEIGAGKVEPVRAGNNGEFEYVNRGGGWMPVSLFGSDGKLKWKYPTQMSSVNAPDDMVALDINNDSVLEFIVGMNGRGGLRAFDYSGKEIWMKDASNVFSVASVRENDVEEIIHTDGIETVVRSLNGDKLRSFKLPFATFVIGRWPNRGNDPVILGMSDMSIRAFDLNGSPVGSLPIQRIGTMVGVTPIDFRGQGVKYYAAVVSLRASMNLSELYLFDRNDSLIYHEVFKSRYPSVTAIPARNSEGEFLLVGGANGTVTQYWMKK